MANRNNVATIDLDELRKEIDADRKALTEKEAVLRFLERKDGKTSAPISIEGVTMRNDGVIQLDELIPAVGRRTLFTDVQDVISRFGDQEFTVVHVEAALKKTGVEVKGGKFPRSRISTALSKLEDTGVIVKTFEGKGNVPHRYKVKENINDLV